MSAFVSALNKNDKNLTDIQSYLNLCDIAASYCIASGKEFIENVCFVLSVCFLHFQIGAYPVMIVACLLVFLFFFLWGRILWAASYRSCVISMTCRSYQTIWKRLWTQGIVPVHHIGCGSLPLTNMFMCRPSQSCSSQMGLFPRNLTSLWPHTQSLGKFWMLCFSGTSV